MTTSQFGGLHGDALTRAQQYVTSARDTINGTNCPCCGQKCKTYRRTITSTMAVWQGEAQVWRDSRFFGSDPRTGKMGWQGSGWDRCPSCHGKRHKAEPHEPIG